MTALMERIEARRPKEPVRIGNRRPVWLRRMDEKGLPAQDRTAYIRGAFVPSGSGERA
jgi:hypothetical protein